MKTYNLIDKNSDIVIIVSGENEEDTLEFVKERLDCLDQFYIEEVDDVEFI